MTPLQKIGILFILTLSYLSCKDQAKVTETLTETNQITGKPLVQLIWETDTTLMTPESVIHDPKYDVYYVSCINGVPPGNKDGDGYISKLDINGKILEHKWITNLHAPKGMALYNENLFVTDIDQVIIINTLSGEITKKIAIPGAKFLNDAATSKEGVVYFSDTETNSIFSYFEGKINTIIQNDTMLGGPNGLFVQEDQIYVASFRSGNISSFLEDGTSLNKIADGPQNGEGIEAYKDGFLCSNWEGEVYFLDKEWQKHLLLDTKSSSRNAADLGFNATQSVLLVPEFFGNKVSAYKVQ
jgi:hypothetical protein